MLEKLDKVNWSVLVANQSIKSQQDIADHIGVALHKLKGHPEVRQRLAEISALYRWTGEELLAEVNRAHAELSVTLPRVTQQDIANRIGVGRETFMGHPEVRQRL